MTTQQDIDVILTDTEWCSAIPVTSVLTGAKSWPSFYYKARVTGEITRLSYSVSTLLHGTIGRCSQFYTEHLCNWRVAPNNQSSPYSKAASWPAFKHDYLHKVHQLCQWSRSPGHTDTAACLCWHWSLSDCAQDMPHTCLHPCRSSVDRLELKTVVCQSTEHNPFINWPPEFSTFTCWRGTTPQSIALTFNLFRTTFQLITSFTMVNNLITKGKHPTSSIAMSWCAWISTWCSWKCKSF